MIIADYKSHFVGEREVVDGIRPEGHFRNVPIVYIRKATMDEYFTENPQMHGKLQPECQHFWEVVTD